MRTEEQLLAGCRARPRAGAAVEGALALCPGTHPMGPDVSAQHSRTGLEQMVAVGAGSTHSWTRFCIWGRAWGLGEEGLQRGQTQM